MCLAQEVRSAEIAAAGVVVSSDMDVALGSRAGTVLGSAGIVLGWADTADAGGADAVVPLANKLLKALERGLSRVPSVA